MFVCLQDGLAAVAAAADAPAYDDVLDALDALAGRDPVHRLECRDCT